ncbi:Uncharacterised protein at_DN2067 [Pycnogonum litorale]
MLGKKMNKGLLSCKYGYTLLREKNNKLFQIILMSIFLILHYLSLPLLVYSDFKNKCTGIDKDLFYAIRDLFRTTYSAIVVRMSYYKFRSMYSMTSSSEGNNYNNNK